MLEHVEGDHQVGAGVGIGDRKRRRRRDGEVALPRGGAQTLARHVEPLDAPAGAERREPPHRLSGATADVERQPGLGAAGPGEEHRRRVAHAGVPPAAGLEAAHPLVVLRGEDPGRAHRGFSPELPAAFGGRRGAGGQCSRPSSLIAWAAGGGADSPNVSWMTKPQNADAPLSP